MGLVWLANVSGKRVVAIKETVSDGHLLNYSSKTADVFRLVARSFGRALTSESPMLAL